MYYRDEIGNISTSHLQVLEDSVEVEVRPRFPLFGGWKTHYMIGYNLPSYEYLYTLGESTPPAPWVTSQPCRPGTLTPGQTGIKTPSTMSRHHTLHNCCGRGLLGGATEQSRDY